MKLMTARCRVRPFEPSDIEPFMTYRNDLDWMRYQSFKGLSYEDYKRSLLRTPSIVDGMQLAIIQKETDELIGDIYVHQDETTYWIGYTISPRHSRQGYAFEVVRELIGHLSDRGAKTIKAGALATNEASIALLKKLNFDYLTTEDDEQIYGLDVTK